VEADKKLREERTLARERNEKKGTREGKIGKRNSANSTRAVWKEIHLLENAQCKKRRAREGQGNVKREVLSKRSLLFKIYPKRWEGSEEGGLRFA